MGVRRREPVFGHHDPARGLALRCAAQVRARRGEPNAVAAAVEGDDGALGAGPPQPHGAGLGLPNSYTGRFLSAIEPEVMRLAIPPHTSRSAIRAFTAGSMQVRWMGKLNTRSRQR